MINLRIDGVLGAYGQTKTICLGYRRANSRDKFGTEEIEDNIEYLIEHETIHLVIDWLFKNKVYSNIVSWLFDYIDYSPRNIIENHEIPERKILLKELHGIQSEHKKMRKEYLKKYYGKDGKE